MMYPCSDDPAHKSTTADFCSVCGAVMSCSAQASSNSGLKELSSQFAAASGRHSAPRVGGDCSYCGIATTPGDLFCSNCGTEYATGEIWMAQSEPEIEPQTAKEPPREPASVMPGPSAAALSMMQSAVAQPTPLMEDSTSGTGAVSALMAILKVDLRPREGRETDSSPPADVTERVFMLDKEVMPFGRTSLWMPIPDAGASRHHGEFVRQPDGAFYVRDAGSSNGTVLNGVALHGQELRKIGKGDVIMVGFWHTIEIE